MATEYVNMMKTVPLVQMIVQDIGPTKILRWHFVATGERGNLIYLVRNMHQLLDVMIVDVQDQV